MKRRVAAILEFVGRMQTERTTHTAGATQQNTTNGSEGSSKGTNTPNGGGLSKSSSGSSTTADAAALHTASLVRAVEAGLKDVKEKTRDNNETTSVSMMDERDFATMGSTDMMETLTRELVQWQSIYGVYSR